MAEVDGIKIKITSDSGNVLKDLQKIEKQAQRAFERASAAVSKTENEIAVLEGRLREIAAQKRTELDIGIQWDSKALDEAVDRALGADKTFQRLSSRLDTLQMKWQTQKNAAEQASAAYEQASQATLDAAGATKKSSTIADKVKGIFSTLADRLGALTKNSKKASGETKKHTRSMKDSKKSVDPLSKSILRLGNMFKLMLLRMAMRKTIDAVKEGLADLAKYSDSFQGTMSRLSTAFLYVRNAITTAAKPALEALAPPIEQVADWFAKAANSVAQFAAALFGNGNTYTQATKAAKQYGDATEKAAKKTDKAMASFDQINQLSFGKQEEAEAPSPDDMFEEAPIDEKVQGLADKLKAFFEQIKGDAGQVWAVFQQSWAQSGETTISAAKNALSNIIGVLGAIASSFKEVWTDGTGLSLLNNLQGLLQTVLGSIGDIAGAFVLAWQSGGLGKQVLQTIMTAIGSVLGLLSSVGSAFRSAWNDGTGERIWSSILSIVQNVFKIIENLAGSIRKAWEENGNGEGIWKTILGIIQSVLGCFERITAATAEWAASVNWEPLMSAFRGLLEAVQPLVDLLLDGFAWAWENLLLPLASWVIEDAAPVVVQLLATAFQALFTVAQALAPVFQAIWSILQPIVSFIGQTVIWIIEGLTDTIRTLGEAIAWVIDLLKDIGLGALNGVLGAVTGGAVQVRQSNPRIAQADTGAYDLRSAPIPRLATGAVIPPNNEFLAVLGDQKRGRNIEAPESAIEEAVGRAMDARGASSGGEITIRIIADGKLARALKTEMDNESRRRGVKLVKGGAY